MLEEELSEVEECASIVRAEVCEHFTELDELGRLTLGELIEDLCEPLCRG